MNPDELDLERLRALWTDRTRADTRPSPPAGDSSAAQASPPPPPPAAPAAPAATPPTEPAAPGPGALPRFLGRYEILRQVGEGGFGLVFEARDRTLGRRVALKCMRASVITHPEHLVRMRREAETAARLNHPGIVPVYEVGSARDPAGADIHFIALGFVEGCTFANVLADGRADRRTRVAMLEEAARAVAFAHAAGVTHRDLKPSNLLVDGAGRVFLTDFGLAISEGASTRLTASGALLGTPQYMSPEQADGRAREVGPPADVHALGAILYEVLIGRPPFRGETPVRLLVEILEEEPAPPRRSDPSVPRDLESVCLKALEKEPARRYAHAGEFADELRRWLAGEPVHARPIPVWARCARRLARHRWIAATGAAVVALALGLLYTVGRARHAAAEKDAADAGRNSAQVALEKGARAADVLVRWGALGATLEALEATRFDSSLPEAEKRRRGAEAWPEIERFAGATRSDATSQAALRALLGWGHRLAGDMEAARADFRRARELDPDLPYAALMEGLACLSDVLARQELPEARLDLHRVTFGPMPAETEELRSLRARTDVLLDEASRARVWGKGVAADFSAAVDAIRDLYGARYAEADGRFSAALAAASLRTFHTDLRFARAKARYLLGHWDAAADDLDQVRRVRPRDAHVLHQVGQVLWASGYATAAREADPRAEYRRAAAAFEEAARLLPDRATPCECRGVVLVRLAQEEAGRGGDAAAPVQEAIAALDEADRRAPGAAAVLLDRGAARRTAAEAAFARGADPKELLARGLADLDEARRRAPSDACLAAELGRALLLRGEVAAAGGSDPRPDFAQALGGAEEAARLDAGDASVRFLAARIRCASAEAEARRGADPRPIYTRALGDCDAGIQRAPDVPDGYLYRASVRTALGTAEGARGGDGRKCYEQAEADFGAALRGAPDCVAAFRGRGALRCLLALAEFQAGRDPRPFYERALADMGEALRRNAQDVETCSNRAATWSVFAAVERARKGDANAAIAAALSDAETVLAMDPKLPAVARAGPSVDVTLRRVGKLVRASPVDPRVALRCARACVALGRREAAHGTDPGPILEEASVGLDAARAGAGDADLARQSGEADRDLARACLLVSGANAGSARDCAFRHLERALQVGGVDRTGLGNDPELAPLHADERWGRLMDGK